MKKQNNNVHCILRQQDITPEECFDTCLVVEYEILPSAFVDGYLPEINEINREKCFKCPYHWR